MDFLKIISYKFNKFQVTANFLSENYYEILSAENEKICPFKFWGGLLFQYSPIHNLFLVFVEATYKLCNFSK